MSARHAAADDNRLTTALSAVWLAGHLAAAALLGMTIHDQQQLASHGAPLAATLPDLPLPATPGEER